MLRGVARVSQRAAARSSSGWAPSGGDRVLLQGLLFHAFHGVLPEERRLGQKFTVDLALSLDLRAAGRSDQLEQTVSYADVYHCVREVVQGPPMQLVESVAQHVAGSVLHSFPLVDAVSVRVLKPHVAMPGALDALGVEIHRVRGDKSLE